MPYLTPLKDFRFALNELAGLDDVLKLPDRKSTRLNSSH